jgi:energy-coupling factor transporter ATP-binding protein EcfA2
MQTEPAQVHSAMLDGGSVFSLQGLHYRYPDGTPALAGIDLDIQAGDRIALVGRNGSGKTTLIKHLCGLLPPTAGQVRYKKEHLAGDYLQRRRLEIGLLFQDPDDQLFGHTLLDDAAFGPRQQGLPQPEAEAAALQALQRVELIDKAYKAPHNLSFGQKKRAALAGLLAMRPQVLLLDEPTSNLDPRQEQALLDLLAGFAGTVICISHDLIFLYELCDRAVVLHHGRITYDDTMRDLVSQRQLLRSQGLDFSFRRVVACPAAGSSSTPGDAAHIKGLSADAHADPPLVGLSNYTFRYPDGTLGLSDIDITIHSGERVAIVGENGAGKTTLLSCLLGLLQGQGGFFFEGRPVTRRRRKALWRQVGMVFQDCADQLFCPSVKEEVAFGLIQLGCSRAEVDKRVEQALALVHLEGFQERVPLHLSGGERKRLALACVLAMEPKLLILDEPTAGLDPQAEESLLEILRNLETTLLLVSHDMFFVGELTHRMLVMRQGRIVEDMPSRVYLQNQRPGHLNGLASTCRQGCSRDIQRLQHEHAHHKMHTHPHP